MIAPLNRSTLRSHVRCISRPSKMACGETDQPSCVRARFLRRPSKKHVGELGRTACDLIPPSSHYMFVYCLQLYRLVVIQALNITCLIK